MEAAQSTPPRPEVLQAVGDPLKNCLIADSVRGNLNARNWHKCCTTSAWTPFEEVMGKLAQNSDASRQAISIRLSGFHVKLADSSAVAMSSICIVSCLRVAANPKKSSAHTAEVVQKRCWPTP